MTHNFRFIFAILLTVSLFAQKSLSLDPRKSLNEMSSDHFSIIYDAKSYALAIRYLEEAERSYKILSGIFGVEIGKTLIVLDDTIDLANGAATAVPRPTVYVYSAMPTTLTSIDHFSNWPRDVFLHEYTHILQMEPTRGVFKVLRYIFGNVIHPTMLLPRWNLEGLAVEMESRYNLKGRLKSPDYDAMIRAFFIDGKWGEDNLSAINEVSTPFWPEGQRPYFYGALLWHEIMEKKKSDPGFLERLNNRYAGRIPFFITSPIRDEIGQSYEELLQDVYTKYRKTSEVQLAKIQSSDTVKALTLTFKDSVFDHSPAISPDGKKIAFISKNENDDQRFIVRDLKTFQSAKDKNKKIILEFKKDKTDQEIKRSIYEPNKISWFPDGKKLVFDGADEWNRTYFVYDLYVWDLETKKVKKITKGLRGREPSVAPDGNRIAYIKNVDGETHLYIVDKDGKNDSKLYAPAVGRRLSRPEFLSNQEIVYAIKDDQGEDHLEIFNLSTRTTTVKLSGLKNSKNPMKAGQGITFTSTDSGVENLYYSSADLKNYYPITNSRTRVINGTYLPGTENKGSERRSNNADDGFSKDPKVFISELTGDGPKIRMQSPIQTKTLPKIEHPIASNYPTLIDDSVPKIEAKEETYWPIKYLYPTYWLPVLYFPDGDVVAGASTSAMDPTGFHSYSLSGYYDTRPEKWGGYGQYNYVNSVGTTSVAAFDLNTYYESLDEATNTEGGIALHSFNIPYLSSKWQGNIRYEYTTREIFQESATNLDRPQHYFTGPGVGILYSDMDQGKTEISPTGYSFSVDYMHYLENSTNTEHDKTEAKINYYHKNWLPDRHVLAFMAKGSYSENNRNIFLATTTSEASYIYGPLLDGFVIRGYPAGEFIGYSMYAGSLEYRFPITDNYRGPNSPAAFFLKRIHATIFTDTVTLKGAYYDVDEYALVTTDTSEYFTTSGLEINFDSTLLYHIPATIKLTLYYAYDKKADGGPGYFVTLNSPEIF